MFIFEFDHFDSLSQFYSEWGQTSKLVDLKITAKILGMRFWSKFQKGLKLLNSVPFIKKTWGNHLCYWIWSFWLTFTVLQWMKTNFEISQFSWFLLRSRHAILVIIWKWLKLLNSVQFIKKTRGNHVYNWISSVWLTLTVLPWKKTNFKISQFYSELVNSKISAKVRVCDLSQNLKMTKAY